MTKTILIAEDEALKLMTLKSQLAKAGYNVLTATDGLSALEMLRMEKVDALVTDVRMPELDGLSLLEKSKELDPARPVIVMTGYGGVEDAVRAMRAGAVDYMTKPAAAEEIILRLERAFAVSRMSQTCEALREEVQRLGGPSETIFVSDKMTSVFTKIKMAAETDATVLFIGETGTGKEVCARHCHAQSKRGDGPFVVVSCAALSPGVVESELFGHEKGAFTGASARREGRLYKANGGTLFLDDVDDIPLDIQAKLLRMLQDSTYERVGGTEKIKADVRFIAATKKNLPEVVEAGKFRDDLMYRLSVVQIKIPPLRERRDDIIPLAEYFLRRSQTRMGRPEKRLTPDAITSLSEYAWPGNVRELEHVIESIVAIHAGDEIKLEDLPERLSGNHTANGNPVFSLNVTGRNEINLEQTLQDFERSLLSWALDKADGNQVKAAQLLQLARSTFQYRWAKLKEDGTK